MTTPQDKAVEALRCAAQMDAMDYPDTRHAAHLLREYAALLQAQVSSKPIGQVRVGKDGHPYATLDSAYMPNGDGMAAGTKLYLHSQPAEAGRVPLTDEAIHDEFHRRMSADAEDMAMDVVDFRLGARFAERHHGILPKEQP